MGSARSTGKTKNGKSADKISSLMVRLEADSKRSIEEAAALRRISVSDYVRTVTVQQAEREVKAAREGVLRLTAEEQLALWTALNEPPKLTAAQKKLGAIMRGEP
jgi:uncharacterized protein (DUF1778 family)